MRTYRYDFCYRLRVYLVHQIPVCMAVSARRPKITSTSAIALLAQVESTARLVRLVQLISIITPMGKAYWLRFHIHTCMQH